MGGEEEGERGRWWWELGEKKGVVMMAESVSVSSSHMGS